MTSPPSGCQRDLHPQAVEHARHTGFGHFCRNKSGSAAGPKPGTTKHHAKAPGPSENEEFNTFPFPGAAELREMMNYFEDYTYFGPDADNMLALARELYPEGFTPFAKWAKTHMAPK